ncbi:hypothetical protein BH10ACT8_BH10ACT8_06360 [soil metagenome]|jgi:hypothetical protein
MPTSVELSTLSHVVNELRTAVTALQGKYGNVPTVARLRNDLERLELDVVDARALPPVSTATPLTGQFQLTDEPYDPAMWADDADDEGLGGYHGRASGTHR